jgi:hypothetical protein
LQPPELDPSLTLTRVQYPARGGNAGNRKPVTYAEFANPCNTYWLTRNEQVSGSSPLVGSLFMP